ncbi:hypothetical protein SDC9_206061 [bioreactor metagenome]|uniref:Uncharacterized protein n=1 Tax=bioreactor metagenome TaxID=1076179 RepID=A0A645J4P0_9ZZZZ
MLGELSQQTPVQGRVATDPAQCGSRSDARQRGQIGVVASRGVGGWGMVAVTQCRKHREQMVCIDGFGDVLVHAGIHALAAFLGHGMRGHGDDRQARQRRLGTNSPGGLQAIHSGHLQIHQDGIVGRLLARDPFQRGSAVTCHVHLDLGRRQQLPGNLLVDLVVFDDQHRKTAQQ